MLLNFIEKSISKIPNLPFSLFFLFLPHFSQSHFAHKTTKNCRRKNLICSTPNLSTPPICNIIEFTKKHDLRFDLDDLTAIEQPQKITLLIKMKEKKKTKSNQKPIPYGMFKPKDTVRITWILLGRGQRSFLEIKIRATKLKPAPCHLRDRPSPRFQVATKPSKFVRRSG